MQQGDKHPLITLENVHFSYLHGQVIFSDLNLTVYEGERIHLKGPNGIGKTTLFYIMLGLLRPEKGKVSLFGKTCTDERDFKEPRKKIGFLFQDPDHQLFCPSVLEDICFAPLNHGLGQKEALRRAHSILDALDITHLSRRPPYRLSGGEKKLAALATILVTEPEVLLLDEPFNGLDQSAKARVERLLLNYPSRAMIIVSHHEKMPEGLINKNAFLKKDGLVYKAPLTTSGRSMKNTVPFPG